MTNSPYNDPEYLALLADWFEHQNTKGRWGENESADDVIARLRWIAVKLKRYEKILKTNDYKDKCPNCGQDLSVVEMPKPGGMFVCRICGTSMMIMD